jgi:hypothetical protein
MRMIEVVSGEEMKVKIAMVEWEEYGNVIDVIEVDCENMIWFLIVQAKCDSSCGNGDVEYSNSVTRELVIYAS